jgi:hypothetical protein
MYLSDWYVPETVLCLARRWIGGISARRAEPNSGNREAGGGFVVSQCARSVPATPELRLELPLVFLGAAWLLPGFHMSQLPPVSLYKWTRLHKTQRHWLVFLMVD